MLAVPFLGRCTSHAQRLLLFFSLKESITICTGGCDFQQGPRESRGPTPAQVACRKRRGPSAAVFAPPTIDNMHMTVGLDCSQFHAEIVGPRHDCSLELGMLGHQKDVGHVSAQKAPLAVPDYVVPNFFTEFWRMVCFPSSTVCRPWRHTPLRNESACSCCSCAITNL